MGLFFKKKDKGPKAIYAPCNGEIVPIESLADQTFATKVMGDGIAINPADGNVYAPVDGTITAVMDTKHAYGITSDDGVELLVHIGQDTVNLKGQHFDCKVTENQKVKKGELLGTFDIPAIKKAGYSLATPIILIAGGEYSIKEKTSQTSVKVGDVLYTIGK